MNKKKDIIKLAKLSIKTDGNLNKKAASTALLNLSRKELSIYVRYLKKLLSENYIRVIYKEELTDKFKKSMLNKYKNRDIIFEKDEKLNGGIKIVGNDTVIDMTFNAYIDNALDSLKSQ